MVRLFSFLEHDIVIQKFNIINWGYVLIHRTQIHRLPVPRPDSNDQFEAALSKTIRTHSPTRD